MTTLKELSVVLGLSVSTISKALNDSTEISVSTKMKVQRFAFSYGYRPNPTAQNLKLGRTRVIGVIIPNVIDEFFAMVLHGIEEEASNLQYKVLISISNDDQKKEESALISMVNGSVDGVLLSLAKETQGLENIAHVNNFTTGRIPMVLFDRVHQQLRNDTITVDDFDGAYKATKYLMDTGCTNIAFLSTITKTSVSEMRKEGYVQAMHLEAACRCDPTIIEINHYDLFEDILITAMQSQRIDAILAADELSAVRTINLLQSNGFKIPDDIAVIGFTNGQMAQYSNPPLTTVSQHAEKIGEEAVKVLVKRILNPNYKKPIHRVIKTEMLVRRSTKGEKTLT